MEDVAQVFFLLFFLPSCYMRWVFLQHLFQTAPITSMKEELPFFQICISHISDNISHKSTPFSASPFSSHPPFFIPPAPTSSPLSLLLILSFSFPLTPSFLPPSCETVSSVCFWRKPQHDTVTLAWLHLLPLMITGFLAAVAARFSSSVCSCEVSMSQCGWL